MRPVRLVAEGFAAFRDRVEIDFSGADYFALVGPTGSGKSSVLDAMCFALYGSVPRYGDERQVAPAITQGANEARVSLTFDAGGDEYVATRVARRTKTGAQVREPRLERGDEVIAGSVREMDAAVAQVLGLSFRQFTRAVLLPQGEFAEFLHAPPAERQDLIVRLLDLGVYEQMRGAASARATAGRNAIALDEQRLTQLADCTPETLADAKERAATLKAVRDRVRAAEHDVRRLEREAEDAEHTAARARQIVEHLGRVAVPKEVRTLAEDRDRAAREQQQAAKATEAAEAALDAQEKELAKLPDAGVLRAQLDAYAELAELEARIADLRAERDALGPRLDDARQRLDEAIRAKKEAEQAHTDAVRAGAHAELVASLRVGEPCPVCGQTVTTKPRARARPEREAARALRVAERAEQKARAALERLTRSHDQASAALDAERRRQRALRARVVDAAEPTAIAQQLAVIEEAERVLAEARRAHQQALRAEREAAAHLAEVDEQIAQARRTCEAQRDPLVALDLAVPGIGTDLVRDWEALAAWAREAIPQHRDRARDEAARAERLAGELASLLEELAASLVKAGVSVPTRPRPTLATLRDLATEAYQDAAAEATRIRDGIREAKDLQRRIAASREEVEVAEMLARLLRADGFERWLVNEALQTLVSGASVILEELSSGQYALAVDERNEFEVIDHRNADERRSVRTLSGGETFQASLALALALAEHVSALAVGGAAKLDAIFLDEGFGTLDADSLDVVASTLEALGGGERMVGIVTHVRDLAERVPVRYEVVKGPRTSTVTRVDG